MGKIKNDGAFISGLVFGSAVGTIIGLLLAPRQGKQTRALLKKSAAALPELAEDLSTTTQRRANHWSTVALGKWDNTVTRLQKAIAAGVEASRIDQNRPPNSSDTFF